MPVHVKFTLDCFFRATKSHHRLIARQFSSSGTKDDKRIPFSIREILGITFLSSLTAGTLYLGSWQTKRYFWKKDLIRSSEEGLIKDPVLLPKDIPMEQAKKGLPTSYQKYLIEGIFLHDKEVLLGPRAAPKGLYLEKSKDPNPYGFYILTPFQQNDGSIVIVNRGWIPNDLSSWDRPTGLQKIIGLIRPGEEKSSVSFDNDLTNRKFTWLELSKIAYDILGLPNGSNLPLYLESVENDNAPRIVEWPYPKRTRNYIDFYITPQTHVIYASTWFTLSTFGLFSVWRIIRYRLIR